MSDNLDFDTYSPIVFKINNIKDDILKYDIDLKKSTIIDFPRFDLGFQHFLHSDNKKIEEFNKFKNKKKVYFVLNEFERYIDDEKNDIDNISINYFNLGKRPLIISRSFFKMWELLFYFNSIEINDKKFSLIHIGDEISPFLQCIIYFREEYCDNKNDIYYSLQQNSKNENEKKFLDSYKKKINFFSNITNFKSKQKVKLIVSNKGIKWSLRNIQEQEMFKIIIEQILLLKNLENGGEFIFRIYETFTKVSSKLLLLLESFFKEVYIVKPLMSRKFNIEKYIVCKEFNNKNFDKFVINFEKNIYNKIDKSENIGDIITNFDINNFDEFKISMITINTKLTNHYLKNLNMIISYLDGLNYHGDDYYNYKQEQIKASNFWINLFLPDKKKIKDRISLITSLIEKKNNKINLNDYKKNLLENIKF